MKDDAAFGGHDVCDAKRRDATAPTRRRRVSRPGSFACRAGLAEKEHRRRAPDRRLARSAGNNLKLIKCSSVHKASHLTGKGRSNLHTSPYLCLEFGHSSFQVQSHREQQN